MGLDSYYNTMISSQKLGGYKIMRNTVLAAGFSKSKSRDRLSNNVMQRLNPIPPDSDTFYHHEM